MPDFALAARAYAASSARRSLREQEADLFWYANAALRRGVARGGNELVRALLDDQRLWRGVIDVVSDPTNALPDELRAAIISVGKAVLRELDRPEPNTEFLLAVNENIARGLALGA